MNNLDAYQVKDDVSKVYRIKVLMTASNLFRGFSGLSDDKIKRPGRCRSCSTCLEEDKKRGSDYDINRCRQSKSSSEKPLQEQIKNASCI